MGKKFDALLGKSFKPSRFRALLNLAVSRVAVFKNQRQIRCSQARSDVLQLLNLGQRERALLRVELVIKEQNMLDVFVMIEGYCNLLSERVNLIQQEKECPDELKEAASSLIFAASRCGEFPELQELRAVLMSRFGKEFVARAVELRNNCGVNPKIIQQLSTRQPSLESRMKVLKEIASENGINLELEEVVAIAAEDKLGKTKGNQPSEKPGDDLEFLPETTDKDEWLSSMNTRKRYKDVADAAREAFQSAAYAAAAARAAVELSRTGPPASDDHGSSNTQASGVWQAEVPNLELNKDPSMDDYSLDSGGEEIEDETKAEDMKLINRHEDSKLEELGQTNHLEETVHDATKKEESSSISSMENVDAPQPHRGTGTELPYSTHNQMLPSLKTGVRTGTKSTDDPVHSASGLGNAEKRPISSRFRWWH
ncbi:hypothetical protein Nepgr_029359 [Nepenthes gracilis]|uniref:IST1-like protein n=1 Tax=Nepenthes gracilis TaxID=150966 RepID=A0AAD3TES4_NEPGR|nr:hypothetical protein Nepgr_029359 [Nepenthes gracilis]